MKRPSDKALTVILTLMIAAFVVVCVHEFLIYWNPGFFGFERISGEVIKTTQCGELGVANEQGYIFKLEAEQVGEALFLSKCQKFEVGDKADLIVKRVPVPAVVRLANDRIQFWSLFSGLAAIIIVVSFAKFWDRQRELAENRKELLKEGLEKYQKKDQKKGGRGETKASGKSTSVSRADAPTPPPPPKNKPE